MTFSHCVAAQCYQLLAADIHSNLWYQLLTTKANIDDSKLFSTKKKKKKSCSVQRNRAHTSKYEKDCKDEAVSDFSETQCQSEKSTLPYFWASVTDDRYLKLWRCLGISVG